MVSSDPVDEVLNKYCQYDIKCGIKCEKVATNQCKICEQIYCPDHYLEHQKKFEKHFEYITHIHELLTQKMKLLISKLSADAILNLIKDIYEFKIKSDEIEETENIIREKLQIFRNNDEQDFKSQLIKMTNELESNRNDCLQNNIQSLTEDIKQLKLQLQKIISQQQLQIHDISVQSDNSPVTMRSPSCNEKLDSQSNDEISTNMMTQKSNDSVLSRLIIKENNSPIIDINENEFNLIQPEDEIELEPEEDNIGVIPSSIGSKITRKIHLSNNIVKYLRGPVRIMVDGTMHVVEVCAQESHVSHAVKKAINKGLEKQNKIFINQQIDNNSSKLPYAEITSDWTFIEENSDRGFTSPSIWMSDPQGRRILVKTQDHPLCAANEWLAYVLGKFIGLPVNQVQIAIYQNKLVTLHTDVTKKDEKIFTFMDLPKQIRNNLLTDPTMQSMDLFDHIIQNCDRNPRNILITMSNQDNINDENTKLKIFLIDHSSCFGMGKLNGISIVASKLHSQHLSVVKFDPTDQAKKFERYLNKLPTSDRILITKTLNRFAAITDNQIDIWMTEIQDLLSTSQYNRIHGVLYRQRDVVKKYIIQSGIYQTLPSIKSNESNQTSPTIESNKSNQASPTIKSNGSNRTSPTIKSNESNQASPSIESNESNQTSPSIKSNESNQTTPKTDEKVTYL